MGEFEKAVKAIPPVPPCPHCGDDRQVERVGAVWLCNVCSKDWPAA